MAFNSVYKLLLFVIWVKVFWNINTLMYSKKMPVIIIITIINLIIIIYHYVYYL